jgi:hypothetical protein
VVETLRFFVREGVQWRELRATGYRVCGARLRRRLMEWNTAALLRRVHAALVRMVRSGPEAAAAAWDVVVDSCSLHVKRDGELTGPNPTDRAKRGTKYHVVVASDGIPLAALPSAANVHDTMLFPALLRLALVVCAAGARLYADAGYDSAENRRLCAAEGTLPLIRGRRATRLRAGHRSLCCRARERLAARQQTPRPPQPQIDDHRRCAADNSLHFRHRQPAHRLLKTVP